MKLYDFECIKCKVVFEALVDKKPEKFTENPPCPTCCESHTLLKAVASSGYTIKGNNSASTRPKGAGSFKRR